jgi:hypothetical protein
MTKLRGKSEIPCEIVDIGEDVSLFLNGYATIKRKITNLLDMIPVSNETFSMAALCEVSDMKLSKIPYDPVPEKTIGDIVGYHSGASLHMS